MSKSYQESQIDIICGTAHLGGVEVHSDAEYYLHLHAQMEVMLRKYEQLLSATNKFDARRLPLLLMAATDCVVNAIEHGNLNIKTNHANGVDFTDPSAPSRLQVLQQKNTPALHNRVVEFRASLFVVSSIDLPLETVSETYEVRLPNEEAKQHPMEYSSIRCPSEVFHNISRTSLSIIDEGEGYDPSSVIDATDLENVGKPHSRGHTFLTFADSYEIRSKGQRTNGTEVILRLNAQQATPSSSAHRTP